MKIFAFLFIFSCASSFIFAQAPHYKQWDKRYGGTGEDDVTCFLQTRDGGYILGGYIWSDSGEDISQPSRGYIDFWVMKTDSLGNRQWDKRFGGIDQDILTAIQQTKDGGYIVGGYTYSDSGEDISQPRIGGIDYWIVKLNFSGMKQWDKRFGGYYDDELYAIKETNDGGYILGGYTDSDSGGDVSQHSYYFASSDFWVVKTDSQGNKIWDRRFGGLGSEGIADLSQTPDGGYILGGSTTSGVSGDVSQPSNDSGDGYTDFWVVKIDSSGNKIWDRRFGGQGNDDLYSLQITADNGFVFAGQTESDSTGDVSHHAHGGGDFWIVKTDSAGNKQWDNILGGKYQEHNFGYVRQTNDSGFLLSGTSYSDISFDKSENNLGLEQSWIVKTDKNGNRQWDKTILTEGHDEAGIAIQTNDGCYAITNYTDARTGANKTQPNWDTTNLTADYWLVKFCDTTYRTLPLAAFYTYTNVICTQTCIDFENISQGATSYQWVFDGALPSYSSSFDPDTICYNTNGRFTAKLIAYNAIGSDTMTLTNYIISDTLPPSFNIFQSGDTLFAPIGPWVYHWYNNQNFISGATEYFYVATSPGTYAVKVSNVNYSPCNVTSEPYSFYITSDADLSNDNIKAYYNSSSGHFLQLSVPENLMGSSLKIYDVNGRIVFQSEVRNLKSKIDMNIASGVYLVRVYSPSVSSTCKIVCW